MDPALSVRLELRSADGTVVRRVRLCWAAAPSGAELTRVMARRMLAARRSGLELHITEADALPVLRLAGLVQVGG